MRPDLSKTEAKRKIDDFFLKNDFSADDTKKIRRLAMKYKIKLGSYRKRFCKECLSNLKGKTRISKGYKTVVCADCGYKNRWKLSS